MQTITSGYPGISGKIQIPDPLVMVDWDFCGLDPQPALSQSLLSDYYIYYSLKLTELKNNE